MYLQVSEWIDRNFIDICGKFIQGIQNECGGDFAPEKLIYKANPVRRTS